MVFPLPPYRARPTRILALLLFLAPTTGCNPLGITRSETWLVRSGRYDLIPHIPVPKVRGPSGCGAQALAGAFCHADPALDPQTECDALPWHDAGANVIEILLAARARGFHARVRKGTWELLAELTHNHQPALLMFDRNLRILNILPGLKPPKAMHWGILSGMSKDRKTMLCAAPRGRHYLIRRKLFLDCWIAADHCTVTISKNPSPPQAEPTSAHRPLDRRSTQKY